MTKRIMATLVLVVALCVVPAIAQAASVTLVNPGFETGNTTGWSPWGTTWVDSWSGTAHEGNAMLGAADVDYSSGIYQDFSVDNPGWEYTYDAYVKTVNLADGDAWLELQWYDASSSQIGSTLQSGVLNGTVDWTPLSIVSNAPGTAATGRIVFKVVGGASGQDSFFDDVSVNAVPEPSSILMLSGGLIGLLVFCKRRK